MHPVAALTAVFALVVASVSAEGHYHVMRQGVRQVKLLPKTSLVSKYGSDDLLLNVYYNDTIVQYGWSALKISKASPAKETKDDLYYAAGFAEGQLTQHRIWQNWVNTVNPTSLPYPYLDVRLERWMRTHLAWITEQVRKHKSTDIYWENVGYILSQLQGMADGYAAVTPATEALSYFDMFALNFQNEMGDVLASFGVSREEILKLPYKRGGCSGFIRPTADDLFMAHTTWSGYSSMLRTYKDYDFAGVRVAMSSFPGFIQSADDWYILNNGLTVQETTDGIYNNEVYKFTIPESVSEWIRVMVSHQVGSDGESWANAFTRYNSGTYNNQYMIVNMNLYTPGMTLSELPDNLLWIASQMPGFLPIRDVTSVVRQQGYWASYNIPYFSELYHISGAEALEKQYGSLFSYTKYARPVIFAREGPNVTDLAGMKRIMRYNHWQTDPASECPGCIPKGNPTLTISCRSDLVPANGTFGKWADAPMGISVPQPFGAIDGKIASYKMLQGGKFTGAIISGPTWDTQPAFNWATTPVRNQSLNQTSHVGQPDLQKWDWIDAQSVLFP